jgi:hypothetical protein
MLVLNKENLMAKIKNVSPLGDLSVPALGLTVKAGDVVEVTDEAAASLLEQTENWAAADQAAASMIQTPAAPDAPAAE